MKVLVTGGSGFLGSNLISKLLKDGHSVICLDNLYSSTEENISEFKRDKNFKFVKHDITNPFEIECDYTFNFACPASPVHYQSDPIFTMKTCVLGIYNVIENCIRSESALLHASTSEIYGDPLIHPQEETYWGNVNPIGIRSCYDEGKRAAETIIHDYADKFDMDFRIVRIFNTYGPKMAKNDGRVVSNFLVQALQGNPITIYGDGNQTRSFCYVDDLINGILSYSKYRENLGPMNIGNPHEFRIKDIADIILKITNSNSKIEFLDLPSDDPVKRKPDITKAVSCLSWKPSIQLNEGLKKSIPYFKKIL